MDAIIDAEHGEAAEAKVDEEGTDAVIDSEAAEAKVDEEGADAVIDAEVDELDAEAEVDETEAGCV